MFKKIISTSLIFLHFFSLGPIREALAFSAQSASYLLNAGMASHGGNSRASAQNNLWQDAIGEVCVGKTESASYVLNTGYIPIVEAVKAVL